VVEVIVPFQTPGVVDLVVVVPDVGGVVVGPAVEAPVLAPPPLQAVRAKPRPSIESRMA
jgi:hypothetical protein